MTKIDRHQLSALLALESALETLRCSMEKSNDFKQYVEDMFIFNFDEYSMEEIIGVVQDHIYSLY